jgi:uncharacterized cupredoxin-like copper-binding protein
MALAATAALALTGCSSAGTSSAAPSAAAGRTVDVTLQEFAVVPAVSSVSAGKVTFNAKNTGPEDTHELVIIKTDLGARALPASPEGKVNEDAPGLSVIGEVEDVEVGKTGTVTLDLAPGKYIFLCNIVQDDADGSKESHYLKGMSIEFTVK